MTPLRLWTRVRRLFALRSQEDRELDDELTFHIAEETRLRVERGASREDAARAARAAFGSVALAKEDTRGVWVSGAMERLAQDLRFGFRIVTNAPVLLLSAVTLVALVIGGNTTVFAIAHAIMSRPAPGIRAENLVTVSWTRKDGFVEPETSYPNYRDLAAQSRSLGPMLGQQYFRAALGHEGGSYAIWAAGVTPNYFQTLGVPAAMGRTFTDSDDQSAAGLVTVISDRAWREYFASAPSVIGQAVFINGLPATVVGVAAPDFRGTQLAPSADAWIPVLALARAVGSLEALSNRHHDERLNAPFAGNFVHVLARLNDDASLAAARTEMAVLWERLRTQYPDGQQDSSVTVLPYSATAGGNSVLSTQSATFLAIFSVITLLTLMIVCANVANLLLGRATVRQRELALRQSLGASRTRIVRMLLAEGLVIALLAGVAAYLFAWWMSGVIARLVTPMVPPAVLQVITATDWTVAGYALIMALGSMAFFTLAPATRAWSQALLPWLKAGEQGVVQGRSRLSSGLVVLQLALAVLLVTSAGLAFRSIALFASADLGFDGRSILVATVNTGGAAVDAQTSAALVERLRTRLQSVPGIESVSYSFRNTRQAVRTDPAGGGVGETVEVEANFVGPDYLRVYGLSVLSGRELGVDRTATVTPAIVTQALAEKLWPGQRPIGRRLVVGRYRLREAEVVGVAPDALFNGNRPTGNLYVLLPLDDPRGPGERTLWLRYRGGLDAVAPAIGRAIRSEDPRVPLVTLTPLDSQLAIDFWPARALATLLTLFAIGSLVIAVIGQYAVVAFDMRRRIREFGVRIAMGASSRQILTSVLQDGFRLTALGLVIGFGLSVLTGIGLSRALYGITPTDPLTYGSVFVLLCVVSIAACSLPAVRASRVNPIATLRQE